jgi:hypothetical protein
MNLVSSEIAAVAIGDPLNYMWFSAMAWMVKCSISSRALQNNNLPGGYRL